VDSYRLAAKVYESGFRPGFIVGIWRGGSPVGIAVQECLEYLGVATDHIAVRTSYAGIDSYSEMASGQRPIRVHGLQYLVDRVDADDALLVVDDVFGSGRSLAAVREELARGAALMAATFGERALPVLVPPWNRIAPQVIAALPEIGLSGLSTHEPRAARHPVPGITQVNTHVDILRWTAPRGFLGEAEALGLLCAHLRERRGLQREERDVDPAEPTGLLTHHLAHDEAAWDFLARLLNLLAGHRAVSILSIGAILDTAGPVP